MTTDLQARAISAYAEDQAAKELQRTQRQAEERADSVASFMKGQETRLTALLGDLSAYDIEHVFPDDPEERFYTLLPRDFPGARFYKSYDGTLVVSEPLDVPQGPEYEEWWENPKNRDVKTRTECKVTSLVGLGAFLDGVARRKTHIEPWTPAELAHRHPVHQQRVDYPYAFLSLPELNQEARSFAILNSGVDTNGDPWVFVQYMGDSAGLPF
jgi:hypothetical protein